jgi:hypothetical protein
MPQTRYRRNLSRRLRRCRRAPRRRLLAVRSTRVLALFLPGHLPPPSRRPFLRAVTSCVAPFSWAAAQNRTIALETHAATRGIQRQRSAVSFRPPTQTATARCSTTRAGQWEGRGWSRCRAALAGSHAGRIRSRRGPSLVAALSSSGVSWNANCVPPLDVSWPAWSREKRHAGPLVGYGENNGDLSVRSGR